MLTLSFVRGALCCGLLALSMSLIGCLQHAPQVMPAQLEEDTTLGAGDEFEVRVFGEKDISAHYQVSGDGTVQFPFLGSVPVAGKETDEVAQAIGAGLREGGYLRDPQVSVLLIKSNSKRVSVLGAVAKPGTFAIVSGMTLVNAVSEAGGFTALASKDDTVVTRRVGKKLERYRIPVSKMARGDAEDFRLRAGDIIFVPERVF